MARRRWRCIANWTFYERSSRVINIFTNFPTAVFQRDVIAGAREVFDQRGYPVTVLEITEAAHTLRPDAANDRRSRRGAGDHGRAARCRARSNCTSSGIPLSLVSHQIPGGHIPGVMTNNRQGIAMLMEHLVVDAWADDARFSFRAIMTQSDGIQRYAAFQQEVDALQPARPAGIHPARRFLAGNRRRIRCSSFSPTNPDFDAVVASDYLMAEAAMQRRSRPAGGASPTDVAVVGFGDGPEAAQAGLTTVAADVTELGRRGARQLIGQIEGLRIRGLTLLSTELIERATRPRSESA